MQDKSTKIDRAIPIPGDISKVINTLVTINREKQTKDCNTMHPIPHNCLNCKHEHYKEWCDYAYGMPYFYELWCGIDIRLMHRWSGYEKHMPENCPYYEYGEPTIHHISDEEKKRLEIR